MADILPLFLPGPRLLDGSAVNDMVDALNNIQGNGTPDAGSFTTLSATGAATLAGATTPSGGLVAGTPFQIPTVPVGGAAYAGLGTDVNCVAGSIYISSIFIPANKTLTGIAVANGATVGTDNGLVALYDAAGALLANSALAGAVTSGADAFQQRAFTATYAAVGPAMYFVAYQANGNTDNVKMIAASTFVGVTTSVTAGSFGTLPSLTAPTTFTADVGPIAYVY